MTTAKEVVLTSFNGLLIDYISAIGGSPDEFTRWLEQSQKFVQGSKDISRTGLLVAKEVKAEAQEKRELLEETRDFINAMINKDNERL